MQFVFDEEVSGRLKNRIVLVKHENEEPIFWEMKKIKAGKDTFRDINAFLKASDISVQRRVFDCMKGMRDILDNVFEFNTTTKLLNEKIIDLYRVLSWELVERWMDKRSSVRLPSDLKEELQEDDRPVQTYLKPDLYALAALSITIKPLVPVWSEYMALDGSFSEINKEIFAYQLLDRSEIIDCPAMRRFNDFVDVVVADTDPGMKNILHGIGSADIPIWTVALLVVTRLSTIELSHNDDEGLPEAVNPVKKMWGAIKGKMPADGGRGGKGDVRSKRMGSETGGEEDNVSVAESYKVREDISDGERVEFDYAAKLNFERAEKLLGPNYDKDLLKRVHARNIRRNFFNPTEVQLKTNSIVVSSIFPTRALPHTDRNGAIEMISLAQVHLHQNGFSSIADLIGAICIDYSDSISSGGQIREDQLNIFNDIYSFERYSAINASRGKAQLRNPGVIATLAIFNGFSNFKWERDIDDAISNESKLIESSNGVFVVPANFKQMVADLIIFLNTNKQIAKP